MIDFRAAGQVDAPFDAVFEVVADLATYPQWLGIVFSAAPEPESPDEPAWMVEIGARLGPLRRSKRLRMTRTECNKQTGRVSFDRAELDARPHSPWHLAISTGISTGGGPVEIGVELRYGGGLPVPGVERLLAGEVRHGLPRLEALARARAG